MIKRLSIIFIIFCFSIPTYPQLKLNVKASATNLFRYGNGKQVSISGNAGKEYLEEISDVRLFINDFLFGIRFEYDAPIEFGKSVKGISRRFAEFQKEGFTVRAGNYYELFEKGLILNAFENRGLGFNTQLDGLKINYRKTFVNKMKLNGTLIAGDMHYDDFIDTSRVENYKIKAVNFSLTPVKYLTAGVSYLFANGSIPSGSSISTFTSEMYELFGKINFSSVELYGSYSRKITLIDSNSLYRSASAKGDGGYASLTYTRPGFGVTIDYKNYRFNLESPDERSNTFASKPLPFQVPPSGIKEHTSTLLSRYPHTVNFGDEVGFQIDAFYSPMENLNFNFNASLSSMHFEYRDIDSGLAVKWERVERSTNFLPSLKDAFSPYWELFFETEYYYRKNVKIKVAAGRQYSVLYENQNPSASDIIKTWTFPVEIKYDFMKVYSLKMNFEQQWVFNSARSSDQQNFFNEFISVSLSRSPYLVLTVTAELSNDKEDASGKKIWGSGEITYKFSSANQLTLSYGSERGGLKCSSGICRYVQPFNGFRLTIINNFN